MRVPLSWLKEYVRLTLPPEEIARRLTFAGLEVEAIEYIGLAPQNGWIDGGPADSGAGPKAKGLAWDPEKIVVAEVSEVMPHPNADRLVLCKLRDGRQDHVVLTGAPNLFPYKGTGPLAAPLKVAYAREGAALYDGHKPGRELAVLKRMKIRGVESYSMICSEKELGISEEHEGVILFPADAPTGMPLAEYMGDVVFTVKINPNMARNANIVGIAREVAALTGQKLKAPPYAFRGEGPSVRKQLRIRIEDPEQNPRFSAALIRDVKIGPSPRWMQQRLLRAGMRPINNIVDITNYVMLEYGEPLHAFDWDSLVARAGGGPVTILTRNAREGERVTTLDGIERAVDPFTILVCDEKGPLSIAGVMGGADTEVKDGSVNILLEAAAWNLISIRRTVQAQKLPSEAAFRMSRGVHPAMTERGLGRAVEMMRTLAGGTVSRDVADAYPKKAAAVRIELPLAEVKRRLGVEIPLRQAVKILESLEFGVTLKPAARGGKRKPAPESEAVLLVTAPDHRLDIGDGAVGQADLIEEIARIYGYDRIPERQMDGLLPPQRGNEPLDQEESVRDLLVELGLQEVLTYHLTAPEREAMLYPPGSPAPDAAYLRVANPIVPERCVMRRSVLAAVMDAAARNAGRGARLALFEIGPAYLAESAPLPEERTQLAIVLHGARDTSSWNSPAAQPADFFDMKGLVEELAGSLHLPESAYENGADPRFHPGRCALWKAGGVTAGVFGELHPQTAARYGLEGAVLAAEIDLDALRPHLLRRHTVRSILSFPPVLEDLAVIVPDSRTAADVTAAIRAAGGPLLADVRLFDQYRGDQVGAGNKSLAFALTYQAPDRTLRNEEAAEIRQRIIAALEGPLGGKVRRA